MNELLLRLVALGVEFEISKYAGQQCETTLIHDRDGIVRGYGETPEDSLRNAAMNLSRSGWCHDVPDALLSALSQGRLCAVTTEVT